MSKTQVLQTARRMVRENGLINLTRRELCERANVPNGSFVNIMGCTFTELVDQLRGEDIPTRPGKEAEVARANPAARRDSILFAACELSKKGGYDKIKAKEVAEAAGISSQMITHYFGGMPQLRVAIMREAVRRSILPIIVQGLIRRDRIAKRAPEKLRDQAIRSML